MTYAPYHTFPTAVTASTTDSDALWTHAQSLPTFPIFLQQLWYRVSNALSFLYEESNKTLTPDIEEAASTLLLDTLRTTRLDPDDIYRELELRVQPCRAERLKQLVHTMLLLTPIVPLDRGMLRPTIFVDIVDVLKPGERLSWAVVSRAFDDPIPDPRYDSLLACLAAALLEYADGVVPFVLGEERGTGPDSRTALKMQCLQVKLRDESDACLTAVEEFRVEQDVLMRLWRREKLSNARRTVQHALELQEHGKQRSSKDEEGGYVLHRVDSHYVESTACDEYAEDAGEDELSDDPWSVYIMSLIQSGPR